MLKNWKFALLQCCSQRWQDRKKWRARVQRSQQRDAQQLPSETIDISPCYREVKKFPRFAQKVVTRFQRIITRKIEDSAFDRGKIWNSFRVFVDTCNEKPPRQLNGLHVLRDFHWPIRPSHATTSTNQVTARTKVCASLPRDKTAQVALSQTFENLLINLSQWKIQVDEKYQSNLRLSIKNCTLIIIIYSSHSGIYCGSTSEAVE